jgi:hypothetical protein
MQDPAHGIATALADSGEHTAALPATSRLSRAGRLVARVPKEIFQILTLPGKQIPSFFGSSLASYSSFG